MEKKIESMKIPKGIQVRYKAKGKIFGPFTGPHYFTATPEGIFQTISKRDMKEIAVKKLNKDPEYLRLCTVENLKGDCAELHITETMLTEKQTTISKLNHIPFATNFDYTNDKSGYDRKSSTVRSIMLTKGFEVHLFTDNEDKKELRMFGPFTGKFNLPPSYYDDKIKVIAVRIRKFSLETECD